MSDPEIFDEFTDLVALLTDEKADFLIVGAYAMAAHGVPRATGDLDVWVRPTPENAQRVYRALARFGAPLRAFGVTEEYLSRPGNVVQFGVAPRRIDVLTSISGVDFATAWSGRLEGSFGSLEARFIGGAELLANKQASGRPKDIVDVATLSKKFSAAKK